MAQRLTIGQFAAATGVPAKTIRYYEEVGVLSKASRTAAGYRQYTDAAIERLRFIRRARALGLALEDVRALAAALENGHAGGVRLRLLSLVLAQLAAVDQQIEELRLLRAELERVVRRMQARPTGKRGGCRCLDSGAPTR